MPEGLIGGIRFSLPQQLQRIMLYVKMEMVGQCLYGWQSQGVNII